MATGPVVLMQPVSPSAIMTAMMGNRNARTTGTGAIPQSETALVLHRLWLTNGSWRLRGKPETLLPSQLGSRSGRDADADRAGHAGAAEPAIARRILGEVLLVIVLGEIECARRRDLGGDAAKTPRRQRLLVGGLRGVGGFLLRIAKRVDRAAILRADVVALTHALGRIVAFPERLQETLVGDLLRIEHHKHHFGVAG